MPQPRSEDAQRRQIESRIRKEKKSTSNGECCISLAAATGISEIAQNENRIENGSQVDRLWKVGR